jgi:tetratricopeptide (TPR) repeat protein
LAVCLEALEIYPLDAQLLCAMGSYLQRREQLSLARRAFETAVRYGQVDMETWHLTEIAEVSAVCYALTLQLEGNEEEAHRQLREAAQRYPNSQRVWRAQLELSIKLGDDNRAAALVREPFVDRQQQPTLTDAVRGACRAAEEDWTAAIGLLQSAYAAGCRHPICLRGLAVTLLSNGQVDAVGPILKLWLSQEPENAEANAYLQAIQQAARTQSVDVGAADSQRSVRIDAGSQPADSPPSQLPNLGQISTHDVHAEDGP